MKKSKKLRGISFIMAIILLVSSWQVPVFAQETSEISEVETTLTDDEIMTAESEKAVVTTRDEFKAALENETVTIIEIDGSIESAQGDSDGPMIITRPLTIQGGELGHISIRRDW